MNCVLRDGNQSHLPTRLVLCLCLLPRCPVGDRLTEAAAVKDQEAYRTKTENRRRQAMDIPAANMRPRPELGSTEVNVRIVERTLGAVTTDDQCVKAFQTSKYVKGHARLASS
jgi:hypothetical protein